MQPAHFFKHRQPPTRQHDVMIRQKKYVHSWLQKFKCYVVDVQENLTKFQVRNYGIQKQFQSNINIGLMVSLFQSEITNIIVCQIMVFISKVNNYMFRPKAAIFRLSQLQFCSKSVIYMSILHSDVEISSSYYMLQVSLSSGMSSGSMNYSCVF